MAAYLGNSLICGPHSDVLVAARPEATLLIADCRPGGYGPTHPAGTGYLDDLRPELNGAVAANQRQRIVPDVPPGAGSPPPHQPQPASGAP